GDGYGEGLDGSPFDGQGIGRLWPLLVGERGHLALQSGEDPLPYLQTMWRCASAGGLLAEQVWNGSPISGLGLPPGRPSGAAMPLVWAHAEFLKLLVAREHGRPIEWLDSLETYFGHAAIGRQGGLIARAANHTRVGLCHWREEVPVTRLARGQSLAIEDRVPFTLHLGFDDWQRIEDRRAELRAYDLCSVVISRWVVGRADELNVTRCRERRWECVDHRIELGSASAKGSPQAPEDLPERNAA